MDGEAEGDWSGWAVSGAGDVNGDGLSDVIVGAELAAPAGFESGRSYVVFGKTGTAAVSLADVAQGIGGFAIDGEAGGDKAGYSLSGAGDVNGDSIPDLVVGAFSAGPDGGDDSGRTYVVFGKTDTAPIQLADVAHGTGGFAVDGEAEGDLSGNSIGKATDINGDSIPDIIVGAPCADVNGTNSGRSYVVFGFACDGEGG
jgi:hypothetical protein